MSPESRKLLVKKMHLEGCQYFDAIACLHLEMEVFIDGSAWRAEVHPDWIVL